MYPMTFEEFLWALGYDSLCGMIKECYDKNEPLSAPLHEKALELYRMYLVVGGMPAVINEYINTKDFNLVKSKQSTIFTDYASDTVKYSKEIEAIRHQSVYKTIPSQLLKENQKFQYAVIKTGARAKDYEDSVIWLEKAGVLLKSYLVSAEQKMKLPFEAYKDPFSFKAFMSDIGLLISKLSVSVEMVLSGINIIGETKGAICENYLAQCLTASGHNLYYWESNGAAEIDFLLQLSNVFIPLECKSADNTKSRSLSTFITRFKPKYSIKVSTKNFGFENNIKSVPLYAVWCIE
jgi:predicted AAA+ superfamily ATPase